MLLSISKFWQIIKGEVSSLSTPNTLNTSLSHPVREKFHFTIVSLKPLILECHQYSMQSLGVFCMHK